MNNQKEIFENIKEGHPSEPENTRDNRYGFIFGIFVVLVIFIFVQTFTSVIREKQDINEKIINERQNIIRYASLELISVHISAFNAIKKQIINNIGTLSEDIVFCWLIKPDGEIFVSSNNNEVGKHIGDYFRQEQLNKLSNLFLSISKKSDVSSNVSIESLEGILTKDYKSLWNPEITTYLRSKTINNIPAETFEYNYKNEKVRVLAVPTYDGYGVLLGYNDNITNNTITRMIFKQIAAASFLIILCIPVYIMLNGKFEKVIFIYVKIQAFINKFFKLKKNQTQSISQINSKDDNTIKASSGYVIENLKSTYKKYLQEISELEKLRVNKSSLEQIKNSIASQQKYSEVIDDAISSTENVMEFKAKTMENLSSEHQKLIDNLKDIETTYKLLNFSQNNLIKSKADNIKYLNQISEVSSPEYEDVHTNSIHIENEVNQIKQLLINLQELIAINKELQKKNDANSKHFKV